jgi:hypothetical protein
MKQMLILVLGWMVSISVFSQKNGRTPYTIGQATSERAQLHTAAFSGLAFLTGKFGADTFFPPGKLADFFGFQYMRDNDKNEKGHNTDFLTRIANNVVAVLSADQLNQLKELSRQQEAVYDSFALKRMVLIKAFRTALEKGVVLNKAKVVDFGHDLYELDARLSYDRAVVTGRIIRSLSSDQRAALARLAFDNSDTWPNIPENLDKRNYSHRAHVLMMTYASELFSWYAGNVEADVYFCPERHGTYFGGFYLKDFPAMGNPDYSISTALTGDSGRDFLSILNAGQRQWMDDCLSLNQPLLKEIVAIREKVSRELRKALSGDEPDRASVVEWVERYGALDAEISYNELSAFVNIDHSLTREQRAGLERIRNQAELPVKCYQFSDPIDEPSDLNPTALFENIPVAKK